MLDETNKKTIYALKKARLALCACNNCLTTDRPDLPRGVVNGWTIDHDSEIALIDEALSALGVPRNEVGFITM